MAGRSRLRVIRYRALGASVVALALVATACSSPSDEGTEGTTPLSASETTIDLSGVSIDSSTVEELDVIRFSGIDVDGDLSQLILQGITDSLDPMDMVLFADDQGLYTIFPLHPENPGNGGEIVLRLALSNGDSQEFDVTVSGLPEAPGAWDRTIAAMLDVFADRAAELGTSLSELATSSMDDLGHEAAVLKMVAGLTDDGSTNDLESLLVRPGEELSTEASSLVDSIIAKIGVDQFLPSPLDAVHVEALGSSSLGVSLQIAPTHFNAERAVLAQTGSCRRKEIPISNGDELAAAIKKGLAARDRLNDPLYQSANDLASNTAAAAGVIAIAGVGTGVLAAPALTVAAGLGAVSAVASTHRLFLEADAGNYPTSFVDLQVAVDLTTFNEDFRKEGHVTSVDVVAASTGFNAAKTFSGIAASAAGAVLGGAVGAVKPAGINAANDVSEAGFGMLSETHIGNEMSKKNELFEFCAQNWTVGIKDSRFVRAWTAEGNIEVNEQTFDYKPTEVGSDTLWMETLPAPFPGVSAITSTPIETKQLEIDADPRTIKVKRAGDIIDVAVILENADTTTLWWEPGQGKWNDGRGRASNDASPRPLKTPTSKDLYPFDIVVEATSDTGLRKGATDERTVKITFQLRKLIVTPDPGGVLVKKTRQFEAVDDEGNPREVKWKATGGSIDGSGLYTAFDKPGAYTVTATATDDPSITETVVVNVVDECLIGTWVLRSQEFFDQVGAQAGGETEYRSGESRLVIREDGTYTTFRNAWSFATVTPQGSLIGVIDAENSGTWIATDVDMFVEEAGGAEETVQLFIEVGGQLQSIPGLGSEQSFASAPFSGQIPYTCKDDLMTSTADGVASIFDRVDG